MKFGNESAGLKLIKVNKNELLKSIRENREIHVKEFNEIYEGFVKESNQRIKKAVKNAKEGIFNNLYFEQPHSHENDYSTVIEMLEMSVDDEVEITIEQFRRYVRDEWDWTDSFKDALMKYSQFK